MIVVHGRTFFDTLVLVVMPLHGYEKDSGTVSQQPVMGVQLYGLR